MDGTPTYQQFRSYATFVAELTDFGLDLRQLQRLLAQCGYGLCVGGLGLGDLPILFKQHADRRAGGSGALTYAGLLQVCGVLWPRLQSVQRMMASAALEGGEDTTATTSSAPRPPSPSPWGSAKPADSGSNPSGSSASGSRGVTFTGLAPQPTPGAGGGVPPALGPSSSAYDLGPSLGLGREASASTSTNLTAPLAGGARPCSAGGAGSAGRASPSSGGAPAGRGVPPADQGQDLATGLHSLIIALDPPVLLREQLPPPPCAFPAIATRIGGIQALYRDGEMTRVALALRDLQRDWEAAAQAAALSVQLRGGGGGGGKQAGLGGMLQQGASGGGAGADGGAPGEVPLEARLWMLLLHGCCLMVEGKHRQAKRSLSAAESLFNPNVLGLEHPYHYCIHLCSGLLCYYEQEYDQAIEKFESGQEVAELVSRGTLDVRARRNAAACLNNKGACHSLLGNRSAAVIAFRAAHQLVRAAEGVPEVPEAVVALRNLTKALKQGFALNTAQLRPSSAPPMYAHVGSTAVPRDQKLCTFLRSAITMRPAAPSLPAWATKTTAAEVEARKKAKEAEQKAKAKAAGVGDKGAKGKGAGPKKKAAVFEALATWGQPSYSVANVKVDAPKARKGGRK